MALANGESQRLAYIAGGFKFNPASANRLCSKKEIKDRVAEIRRERADQDTRARQLASQKSGVDRAWIQLHFKQVALLGMRGEPVRYPDGRKKIDPETGAVIYKPNLEVAHSSLVSLGRMEGVFIDRTEVGGPGDFSRMADDELSAAILKIAEDLGLPAPGLKMLEHLTKETAE